MKSQAVILIFSCIFYFPLLAQQNNTLKGKVLYLSSGHKPAVGVEVSGIILLQEKSNIVYTTDSGAYKLVFPKARTGHKVTLVIGKKDSSGSSIEVVNEKEVNICQIPAKISNEFNIIVCPKGGRDIAARKYYKIIKNSSEIALQEMKEKLNSLSLQREEDIIQIADLSQKIIELKAQSDSLILYKQALQIASINKDNASKRILKYIQLLDEGKSIQKAREALSINGASHDFRKGISLYNRAVEEIQSLANSYLITYDFHNAISCYDTLIYISKNTNISPLLISHFYKEGANIYMKDGQYEKALKYDLESMQIRERFLSPNDEELIVTYHNVASTYRSLGQYEKAMEYHQKCMIFEEILNPNHPALAQFYLNIGGTYEDLGKYNQAIDYYKKSRLILEKILKPEDTKLAESYLAIGSAYHSLGQYPAALKNYEISKNIFEKDSVSNYFNLSKCYRGISLVYQFQGRYFKALEFAEMSNDILSKVLKPMHPELAYTNQVLGDVYNSIGQYKKALIHFIKCNNILENTLPENHPDLAIGYLDLASTLNYLGSLDSAKLYCIKSINILKEVLPHNHPELAWSYSVLGEIYQTMGQYSNSLKYFKKSLEINEISMSMQQPELAWNYADLGHVYTNLEKYDTASFYLQKSKPILEKVLDANNPALGTFYWRLAILYYKKRNYSEAVLYQNMSYEIYKTIFPEENYLRQKVLDELIKICREASIYFAEKNEEKEAYSYLEKALELGYSDGNELKNIINWILLENK